MLRAIISAFTIPDLRRKLMFTLGMIGLYRLGSWIPAPGINVEQIRDFTATGSAGGAAQLTSILNVFSGGALQQMAIFALGIMPYITASIIMQLMVVVIPKLEQMQKEGQSGQAKITQYSRYLTIVLAVLQSTTMTVLVRNQILFPGVNPLGADAGTWDVFLIVVTLTAGTALLMWIGELITQHGVGNGMSLLIFVSIISQVPSQAQIVLVDADGGPAALAALAILTIFLTFAVVFIEQGQRRVPVQYARRQVGRRTVGGQSTYIPLKVNQSGVIPVIFASSLLYVPSLLANISGWDPLVALTDPVNNPDGAWLVNPATWQYIAIFALMTLFFAYFYTSISFNPYDVADTMKTSGGFIPGIRAGRQTAEYLEGVVNRLTLPGATYLTLISILPFVVLALTQIDSIPLGGVSLLIMVGVALETMKQVESQLMQRNYEGFLS